MEEDTGKRKVYSPDITPYSMEGNSGLFGTISSLIVGPIRLVSRVMHNIFVLSADMQKDYAEALIRMSVVFGFIGVCDFFVFHKWPLLIAQIPALILGLRLKNQAQRSLSIAQEKRG